jgi:hypothetical protein
MAFLKRGLLGGVRSIRRLLPGGDHESDDHDGPAPDDASRCVLKTAPQDCIAAHAHMHAPMQCMRIHGHARTHAHPASMHTA